MTVVPALLLIVFAAVFGAILVWLVLGRRERGLRAHLAKVEAELRTQQASQAQIMHTTKLASLGQMVAGVAHEINTPLGFVKSNVEVVGDLIDEHHTALQRLMSGVDMLLGADPSAVAKVREAVIRARVTFAKESGLGDAKDLLNDAIEGIKTISSLVLNLKGFARVDRDGLDLIDLNESVRSALTVAGHQLRDRIKVMLHMADLPKVRCMPSQINQVFLNLITNAAQAIPGDGTLTIVSRVVDGSVEMSFADTGGGIPEAVLPRIFDPFFTTKGVGEGTGLGLSIVHKIIKAHGGTIHVKTTVGRGTTFTISLPLEARATAPAPVQGKAA
jgi:two-component system, NtrC family, sensor kinase